MTGTDCQISQYIVFPKLKFTQQMHPWDWLFDIIVQVRQCWLWKLYLINLVSCSTHITSMGTLPSEQTTIYSRKLAKAVFMDSQDRFSIWLCCSEMDAIQNMQICSLALHSLDHQYLLSRSSKPMVVKLLCNRFGWLPLKLHSVKSKFTVFQVYNALKLCWFSIKFTFAREDANFNPLT